MVHDRLIHIATGENRAAINWKTEEIYLSDLWKRLEKPVVGEETIAEFLRMKKSKQDGLKDVGGFVGGMLKGIRRKASEIAGRDLITLDLDNIPAGGKDEVLSRVDALGYGYCVYSTRKHRPEAPRLRVLLPLDRTVTADEYEPIARKIAENIGMQYMDPTTFEVNRLMFWASCCKDSEYVYQTADRKFIPADEILGMYEDWKDVSSWAQIPGAQADFSKLAKKQGDPEAKGGIVGAFCRAFDVYRAMDELIPGVYEPTDTQDDRYTYMEGSTTGGAVVYDGGKFLYSYHATDPCSQKLVNSFDLVRIHKYSDMDDDTRQNIPTNKLPSYKAMREFASTLGDVSAEIMLEKHATAVEDFAGLERKEEDIEWLKEVRIDSKGNVQKTISNLILFLENEPSLKGRFYYDAFADRMYGISPLPWGMRKREPEGQHFDWKDADDSGLRDYIERLVGFDHPNKLTAAFVECGARHAINPVQDYLRSLDGKWDGKPRLDTLFVDYLGAEDNKYTRAVTRKSFVGAVSRAMTPGIKFDTMLILGGPQGTGKSTSLGIMGGKWFNDSMRSFEGKEAAELLQGTWIAEIAELDAFRKAETDSIKHFLTVCEDRYRAAYGRRTTVHPRACVFFGTTNSYDYLRDVTGNRRFLPVDVALQKPTKDVFEELAGERDQIWAEAYVRWQVGEPLVLPREIEAMAREQQEAHMESNPIDGIIQEFLERKIPVDWEKWTIDKRLIYWEDGVHGEVQTKERELVCIVEIWVELFKKPKTEIVHNKRISHEIGRSLRRLGWKSVGCRRITQYSVQMSFKKL